MEIWKPYIKGYYEASSEGNIRSVDRTVIFCGTPGLRKGITLKQTVNSKGYLTVIICVDGTRKTEYSHRIIAKTFLDNPENKPEVNHKNGKVLDNNVLNLEWVTYEENYIHAQMNGLISRGSCKLVEEEVREIKFLLKQGCSNPELARVFNVNKATIRQIRVGNTWTHIK